jgi:hypothetical protein
VDPNEIVVENDIVNDEIEVEFKNQEVDFDCISMGSEEDPVLPMLREDGIDVNCARNSDWRGLFNSNRSLGNLQYFSPLKNEGKVLFLPRRRLW